MTTNDLSVIYDRIAKLQNLTVANGATEAEAAQAVRTIQTLVDRYNLSLAAIAPQVPNKSNVVFGKVEINATRKALWEFRLADVLACGFNCKVLRNAVAYSFVGRKLDSDTVIALFKHLVPVLTALARAATNEYACDFVNPRALKGVHSLATFRTSWLNGAVDAIEARLQERLAETNTNTEKITALVVVRDAEINEAIADHYGKIKTISTDGYAGNATARQQGYTVGQAIALTDKQVKERNQ